MSEKIKLAICVSSSGQCKTWFASSLAGFMGSAQDARWWPTVESVETTLFIQESSVIHGNRERLVHNALDWEATHVLFLDDDMVFDATVIQSLFSRRHPIVVCNYPKRGLPLTPTAVDMNGKYMQVSGKSGIEEAQWAGFGVALIESEVFRKVSQPWFLPVWSEEQKSYTTEDLPFYQKAREQGYKLWVDLDASKKVGHHGSWTFRWLEENNNGR